MISIQYVQFVTAREFGVPLDTMKTRERTWQYTRPRQVAMMLAREFSQKGQKSLPYIGLQFVRDHTCVMNAIRQIPKIAVKDRDLARKLHKLRLHLGDVQNSDVTFRMERAAAASVGAFLCRNSRFGYDELVAELVGQACREFAKSMRHRRRRRIVFRHTRKLGWT